MTKKSHQPSSSSQLGEDEINIQTSKGNACAILDSDKFSPPHSIMVEYLNHCFLSEVISRKTEKMPVTHVYYAYMSASEVEGDTDDT